jgi:hypothetical protein
MLIDSLDVITSDSESWSIWTPMEQNQRRKWGGRLVGCGLWLAWLSAANAKRCREGKPTWEGGDALFCSGAGVAVLRRKLEKTLERAVSVNRFRLLAVWGLLSMLGGGRRWAASMAGSGHWWVASTSEGRRRPRSDPTISRLRAGGELVPGGRLGGFLKKSFD